MEAVQGSPAKDRGRKREVLIFIHIISILLKVVEIHSVNV